MASLEEIPSCPHPPRNLTLVPARSPSGLGWLNLARSLRAQTVVLFVLLVGFAAGAEMIVQGELRAGDAADADQVGLITVPQRDAPRLAHA